MHKSLVREEVREVCPECGSTEVVSLAELSDLVSTTSFQFSPDLAVWLIPPKSPDRPISKRRFLAFRNSVAFGAALATGLTVAIFALFGSLPSWPFGISILTLGAILSLHTWRSESQVASDEEVTLLKTHSVLYRAYLKRRRVWARLRYCCRCSLVTDPLTTSVRSLFEVHELTNQTGTLTTRRRNEVTLH